MIHWAPVCVVHKNLHGTGSRVGTGLCPSESPTVNAREVGRADPSDLDFACELDPVPVISMHRLKGCYLRLLYTY